MQNREGCFLFNLIMHNYIYIYIADMFLFYINECIDIGFKFHLFLSHFSVIFCYEYMYICVSKFIYSRYILLVDEGMTGFVDI